MKIFKRLVITFVILLVSIAVFIMANIYYSKYVSYPKWVEGYLQSRYTENMVIKNISFSDMGWLATVSPKSNPNIQFSVRGKHIDTYLERSLEYQAEQTLEENYPAYSCQAQIFGHESISTPFPELYQFYQENGMPPRWSDLPDYIRLERLRINTYGNISDQDKQDIFKTISEKGIRTNLVEIFDGDNMYTYKYDMNSGMYMDTTKP